MPKILLMLVKKAVYYVLAAGPFLLLGIISINSRMSTNHWDFVEYGPETSERIFAYVVPIERVRATFVGGVPTSRAAHRETIDLWLALDRSGDLRDIPPATTMNDGTSAVYEQVLAERQVLVDATVKWAKSESGAGNYSAAAELLADAIDLANIAKFSEFSSLAESANYQAQALAQLASISPRLSEEQRAMLLKRLEGLEPTSERSLSNLVDRYSIAYSRDLRREGRSTALIEAARDRQKLASTEDPIMSRIEGLQQLSISDRSLISLYGRSRMATIHHARFEKQLEMTRLALGQPSSN